MEKISKKDFIEIQFTGMIKDGEIFDSNIKEDLEKAKLNFPPKPLVFCIGEKMFIEGVDDFLIGKEMEKEYEIELTPEKAFGKRNPSLVKIIPMKFFKENDLQPYPGAMFNFDNLIAKIISVSGGRVITDFNNPLAGKIVIYKVKVTKKIVNPEEKVKALMDFFFKKEFSFEIKGKKLIIDAEKEFVQYIDLLKDKFKEILDLEVEIKGKTKEKKEDGKDKETKK